MPRARRFSVDLEALAAVVARARRGETFRAGQAVCDGRAWLIFVLALVQFRLR